jgi:hypothetical protein
MPHHNSPASVPLLHTSDKRLGSRLLSFELRPLPAYKTGNGEALECHANFCTRDIGTRLVLRRSQIQLVSNLKTQ